MKCSSKMYYIFITILNLILIKALSESKLYEDENLTKYSMDTYDVNDNFLKRYDLTFNTETHRFNEYTSLFFLQNVKYIILYNNEDIDKKEDINTLIFWNVSTVSIFYSVAMYINAFPYWYLHLKKNNETFRLRIDSVGWHDNAYMDICKNDGKTPCPDLIILETNQLMTRYYKDDILILNKYFKDYYRETGKSFESLLKKYSYYEYQINNNWLAVPLLTEFRVLRFNITTFNYCMNKGYDLKYPPPLNDYWGQNYKKTWTWEKAFEYAKIISECTKKPGLTLLNKDNEETILFVTLCQSLNIPFLSEDEYTNLKKCGFRNKNYIDKLLILKDLAENKYIESWFDQDEIKDWQNSSYEKKIFKWNETIINTPQKSINGMLIDTLFNFGEYNDIKTAYIPGTSSYLGGSGVIITRKSKFPDQAFEFIKVLINDKYPYFSDLNVSVSPFENTPGNLCLDLYIKKKKDLCNDLLEYSGTFPYYYNINNITNIIYLTHLQDETDNTNRGIVINTNNSKDPILINLFKNNIFKCDNEANIIEKTITYYDKYKLEIPLSDNNTLILHSMIDVMKINIQQSNEDLCKIYDETLKLARPIAFPFSNFPEINNIETKSPISLMFAHLMYKHNDTGSFYDIINECCDIIDESLIPYCTDIKDIKFKFSECDPKSQKMTIEFINCKTKINDGLKKDQECFFLPRKNYKAIILEVFSSFAFMIEVLFIIIVIIHRKHRCIYISGLYFLIFLQISSIILNISSWFWIGKLYSYKCSLKIWLTITGITGLISSYSLKSEMIISVYNNNNITKTSYKDKKYFIYIVLPIIQILFLIVWTITHQGIEINVDYLSNIGEYQYNSCSIGNESILNGIFIINYILLILSIIMSYRGRNIPNEFNDSKKIFTVSLISILLLTICYISIINKIHTFYPKFIFVISIILISLVVDLIFVGSKVLIIYNINFFKDSKPIVVVNNSDKTSSSLNSQSI